MVNPGIERIGQISINVHDVATAVRFYRDTLQLRLLFEVPPKMAFFDCGGVRLMLSLPEKPEFDHPGSILYFKVHDIHAAHRILQGRGVVFEAEPHSVAKLESHELWLCFFRDSENNLLALMSEVPKG
ncbi:MAG TPA: VOC family protein [Candidatus Polarisedimenticolia bacterium]|nr:VOC family protein [Candidatus Polarisedimenticolia bacterium]